MAPDNSQLFTEPTGEEQVAPAPSTTVVSAAAQSGASNSLGGRVADVVARCGGSWWFILCAICFLFLWMIGNEWLWARYAFDVYPFIFLNLILSVVAALQAPIIMMSQNRQAERDHAAAYHDYQVNMRAERDISRLHLKVDRISDDELSAIRADIKMLCQQLDRLEKLRAD